MENKPAVIDPVIYVAFCLAPDMAPVHWPGAVPCVRSSSAWSKFETTQFTLSLRIVFEDQHEFPRRSDTPLG
jgi:hypothetical protein